MYREKSNYDTPSSQLKRPKYKALIHLPRYYIFAMRNTWHCSAFRKGISHTSKNRPACYITHIGHEGNHLKCSLSRLKCNFGLSGALFFNYLQRGKNRALCGGWRPLRAAAKSESENLMSG